MDVSALIKDKIASSTVADIECKRLKDEIITALQIIDSARNAPD